MNGLAVADACRQLRTRLVPLAAEILQCAEADVSFEDGLVDGSAGRSIPFPTLTSIAYTLLRDAVDAATDDEKLTLIRAHPDLAGKLARSGTLTEASSRAQTGLGLDQLTDEEFEQFSDLNRRYRERFGFPFIICARRTTRPGVIEAFERRLRNSQKVEISEALLQIHEIARLRLRDDLVD